MRQRECGIALGATRALGELSVSESTELLVKQLKDEDVDVRVVAILGLGQRADTAGVNPLAAMLLESDGCLAPMPQRRWRGWGMWLCQRWSVRCPLTTPACAPMPLGRWRV